MFSRYISRAFLCHVVFIQADPLESSLKVPQPFAGSAFIALGGRAADRLEERSSFLNILNHVLSVFWQHTLRPSAMMAEIQSVIESAVAFYTVNTCGRQVAII